MYNNTFNRFTNITKHQTGRHSFSTSYTLLTVDHDNGAALYLNKTSAHLELCRRAPLVAPCCRTYPWSPMICFSQFALLHTSPRQPRTNPRYSLSFHTNRSRYPTKLNRELYGACRCTALVLLFCDMIARDSTNAGHWRSFHVSKRRLGFHKLRVAEERKGPVEHSLRPAKQKKCARLRLG